MCQYCSFDKVVELFARGVYHQEHAYILLGDGFNVAAEAIGRTCAMLGINVEEKRTGDLP